MADQFVRSGGVPWKVSPNQAQQLVETGAKPIGEAEAVAGSQALRDLSYVDQNWGVGGQAAMGGLSGLTLGLGPGLLANAGLVDPGHLGAAQTSTAYTLGDVAGTIAPAILSGGESLAGRALAHSPAGLMSTLGSASERMAGGLLGDSAGLLGRMGSAPIRMAARGATEGALLQLGHTVGDSLIQNKDLSAEALWAAGVDGALGGGLIGGTLGTVGALGNLAVDSLGAVGRKVAGKSGSGLVAKSLGMGPEDILAAERQAGGLAGYQRASGELLESQGSSIGDSVAGKRAAVAKAEEIHTAARTEVADALEKRAASYAPDVDRITERAKVQVWSPRLNTPAEGMALKAVEDFSSDIKGLSNSKSLTEPVTVGPSTKLSKEMPPGYGGTLSEWKKLSGATEVKEPGYSIMGVSEAQPGSWKGLIATRDDMAAKLETMGHNSPKAVFQREFLNILDDEIRQGMEGAGKAVDGLGGISEKYSAATQALKLSKELGKTLGDKAAKAMLSDGAGIDGRDLGFFGAALASGHLASGIAWLSAKGIAHNLTQRLDPVLAQMAHNQTIGTKALGATQSAQGKIKASLGRFFRNASSGPYKAAQVVRAEKASKGEYGSARKQYEAEASRAEQLLSASHQDKVRRYAEGLAKEGYEQLALSLLAVNHRATQYLTWSMPARHGTKVMTSLRKQPADQGLSLEEYKFKRLTKGAGLGEKGPLGLLDDLENGSLSRDQVQAFKYIYPELHSELVGQVTQQVFDMKVAGDTLPMDKIAHLGTVLDAPIDRTLESDYVSSVQVALNATPAGGPPPQQPSQSTVMALDQSGLLTPLQSLSV